MKKWIPILSFSLLVLGSCIEFPRDFKPEVSGNFKDMNVSQDFSWSTTKEVNLNFSIVNGENSGIRSRVSVYAGDPEAGGALLTSGSLNSVKPFSEKLLVGAAQSELFLKLESPLGQTEVAKVSLSSTDIKYVFGEAKIVAKSAKMKSSVVSPVCGSANIISGNGTFKINKGKVFNIVGNFTGKLNFEGWDGGGTVQVCGTAVVSSVSLDQNCKIVVTNGGSLKIGSINMNNNASSVIVYTNSTLEVTGDLQTKGILSNYGTLKAKSLTVQNLVQPFVNEGDIVLTGKMETNTVTFKNNGTINTATTFTVNSSTDFENNGRIQSVGNGQVNTGVKFVNNGEFLSNGTIEFNSTALVTNNCKIMSDKAMSFNNTSITNNAAYLASRKSIDFNSTNTIALNNGSMISTPEMVLNSNSKIVATGTQNSVKVPTKLTSNSGGYFSGTVEVVTNNFVFWTGSSPDYFRNGATKVAVDQILNYIPASFCNPEGVGELKIVDADLDGIPDDLDEYPNDADKAFSSYFPTKDGIATVAFEDLWPYKGDYDFNDLALVYSGIKILNADNKVVEMNFNFEVKAIGAALKNGFGFELMSVTPDQILSVTGTRLDKGYVKTATNGTEQGHDKAVIIVFESANSLVQNTGVATFNTTPGAAVGKSDILAVNVKFATPVSATSLSLSQLNPFMIVDQTRGREIHLPDFPATNLADATLLGTGQDVTDAATGKSYRSKNGLPWALMIYDRFDYPIEKGEITEAYLKLAEWASSNGAQYPDWYMDKPGYRSSSVIFKR